MNDIQNQQPKDNFHAWLLKQISVLSDYLCVETNPLTYIEIQGKLGVYTTVLAQYISFAYGEKIVPDTTDVVC